MNAVLEQAVLLLLDKLLGRSAVDAGARLVHVPAVDDRRKSRAIRASIIHRAGSTARGTRPRNCEPDGREETPMRIEERGSRCAAINAARVGARRCRARGEDGAKGTRSQGQGAVCTSDSTPFEQPRRASERATAGTRAKEDRGYDEMDCWNCCLRLSKAPITPVTDPALKNKWHLYYLLSTIVSTRTIYCRLKMLLTPPESVPNPKF
jgi:hypothetical protein